MSQQRVFSMSQQRVLFNHVSVPVANEDDARKTVNALAPDDPQQVTALHVVEKRKQFPDKTPVELSEDLAAQSCRGDFRRR